MDQSVWPCQGNRVDAGSERMVSDLLRACTATCPKNRQEQQSGEEGDLLGEQSPDVLGLIQDGRAGTCTGCGRRSGRGGLAVMREEQRIGKLGTRSFMT
jgi:hypothetical protein